MVVREALRRSRTLGHQWFHRNRRVCHSLRQRMLITWFTHGSTRGNIEFIEKEFFAFFALIVVIIVRLVGEHRRRIVRTYLIQLQETIVGQIMESDRFVRKKTFHHRFDLADRLFIDGKAKNRFDFNQQRNELNTDLTETWTRWKNALDWYVSIDKVTNQTVIRRRICTSRSIWTYLQRPSLASHSRGDQE